MPANALIFHHNFMFGIWDHIKRATRPPRHPVAVCHLARIDDPFQRSERRIAGDFRGRPALKVETLKSAEFSQCSDGPPSARSGCCITCRCMKAYIVASVVSTLSANGASAT